MANYLTYPCKTMRISQRHDGGTSHARHKLDRPWDESCSDGGRDWCYCPCNEMVIKRITGVGTGTVNTVFLTSTTPVLFADGTTDYVSMQITHSIDSDLRRLKVGQKFYRGEKICQEGGDGGYKNHFHFSARKGQFNIDKCWTYYKGAWCISTTNPDIPTPDELFFLDTSFTNPSYPNGYKFTKLPPDAVIDDTTTLKNGNNNSHPVFSRTASYVADIELTWKLMILTFENPIVVAGIMGNIEYEAAFVPARGEWSYLGKSTEASRKYTENVENGIYSRAKFIDDRIGYGLVGWTHPDVKEPLYDYWKKVGGSIGSLLTQIEFLYLDLRDRVNSIYQKLLKAKTPEEAADIFLRKYEIPKNIESASVKRKKAARTYYDTYKNITAEMAKQEINYFQGDSSTVEENKVDFGLVIDWIAFFEDKEEEEN